MEKDSLLKQVADALKSQTELLATLQARLNATEALFVGFARAVTASHPDLPPLRQAWDEEVSGLVTGAVLALPPGSLLGQHLERQKEMIDAAMRREDG